MSKDQNAEDFDGENYEVIFSAYITLRNGKRIYASQYGKDAFAFRVKKGEKRKKDKGETE